ncbi:adhesion G protein-coupled receptor A2 isoform X1 [Sphaerodactylus townsendi]|uniref:adhesion G protein-coupled receptor A2 isoform X1 n=1 Tax=Sphaerodactylus townsendi TaxID=933632 RepID=UPI00202723ED|nr:adhesion G protein-coupled receptor A2 isoform X1 [Sphaerodactylus townsendi]
MGCVPPGREAPSRMRWAGALLLLAALGSSGGTRGCPLQLRGCKCVDDRPKGLAMPGAARKRVSCSGQDLGEPPAPRFLPNGTVTLILSNNKIAALKNGSFFGLGALEKLDLKNNLISTIQPGAFLGLSNLKRLDLSSNRIGCISEGIFQGLTNLIRLNVSGNIFSSLQFGVFDHLLSLKVIDFATEYLTCDCNMRWVLSWSKNQSIQISDKTLCIYPSTLHGKPVRNVRENQMRCEGAPELHTHQLIPSLRQVVFQGDRLPFQCTATYLDNSTHILWHHNHALVQGDERSGIILEESLIHDCTFITSELILSNIHVSASGEWECTLSTAQGNVSKKVEIVVLETSASYCPAERVTNNRGDFRWPRTLAGITAYQSCLQYPFTSGNGGPGMEKQAWRRCDRTGHWEEGDYSHCLYTNDITRVLYTFVLMPINASNALTLAHQLRVYTAEAANFSDMMDVIYVSQMIEKFTGYVDQIKQSSISPKLTDVIVEMASNMMLVDDHVLWMAQIEDKACTSIVHSLERIAGYTLSTDSQHVAVNSRNIAFEAYLIKPESYTGLSCTAFQKHEVMLGGRTPRQERYSEPLADQQLKFRCTTGRPNISLASFHVKNSIALASIQLPPGLFSSPAHPHLSSTKCKLQLLAFRNGKLFCSTGNSSHLADDGKRRSVATPVIYSGTHGCGVNNLTEPAVLSLRHLGEGTDRMAAYWDFDVLAGYGGWRAEGCQLVGLELNVTTVSCRHLNNVAVLMELSNFPRESQSPTEVLHPVIYTCTAILLLCLFATIITYIVNHSAIHISRKCWHMLLNLCFHIAMTSAVFAGGITLTNYLVICQAVGIILHYSSLSTLLWMAVMARVIYKEAMWKAPQQQEGEAPLPAPRPMLRFYLIAGGIPLIICGITAAVNIHNYRDHDSYCWLACRPSIGAFYVPMAFILLITWIYFLCAGISLQGQAKNLKEMPRSLETPPRLGGSSNLLSDSGSISVTLNSGPNSAEADGVYSVGVQFWALMITHFLYITLWAFGATAVSQRWFLLKVVFSCLYGVTAIVLGLFIFVHHCGRRRDVQSSWFACCPSYRNALPMQAYVHPGVGVEDGSQVFIGCSPEAAHSVKSSSSPSSTNSAPGSCKLNNLQVALGQAESNPLPTPSYEDPEPPSSKSVPTPRYANNLHGRNRHHKSRTKQYREGKHQRLKALRGPSSEHPASESGSFHNSLSESYQSSRNSPLNNRHQGLLPNLDSALTQSDLSDGGGSSSHQAADVGRAQRRSTSRDNLRHQGNTVDKETKRRSFPLNVANQNGGLKGSKYDINLASADSTAGMRTGLWKSETTV